MKNTICIGLLVAVAIGAITSKTGCNTVKQKGLFESVHERIVREREAEEKEHVEDVLASSRYPYEVINTKDPNKTSVFIYRGDTAYSEWFDDETVAGLIERIDYQIRCSE